MRKGQGVRAHEAGFLIVRHEAAASQRKENRLSLDAQPTTGAARTMEGTTEAPSTQSSVSEQGMTALQVVQAVVADSMKTALSSLSQDLLDTVDRRIAAQLAQATTPTSGRTGESSSGVHSMLVSGQLPVTASLSSMPVISMGVQPAMTSSCSVAPALSQPHVTFLSALGSNTGLSPETLLSNLLSLAGPTPFSEAIAVGTHSPPVPKKIAEKIWSGVFVCGAE